MSKEYNEHQKQAISLRGKSIVVSAAAGSGKTSVLTERILRLIEEGEDIERMLIVTFTNLAASEMKERIYTRLSREGIEKNQLRLAVQAEKSIFSDISTIHVFCNNLIRDNFEYAGVSPTFSVASDAETALLWQRALDTAIKDYTKSANRFLYRYAPRGNFNGIKNIVSKIYSRIISTPNPIEWLENARKNFKSEEFIFTLFCEYKEEISRAANTASEYLKQRSELWDQKGFPDQALQSENERIHMLRKLKDIDIHNVVLPEFAPPERFKGAPYGAAKSLTNKASKCFDDLRPYSGDFYAIIKDQQEKTKEDGLIFLDITHEFMKQYARLKREKNVLDHDDSLHFAIKVLSEESIAKRYRDKYTHVFVDEYQDINNVQNAIINKVKRHNNDFFVGDVKQCIYMFRESNPDLLINRCNELKGSGLVEMNTNYRSVPTVIDFINDIMQCMMSEDIGGVSYSGGHMLNAGLDGIGDIKVTVPLSNSPTETEALAIAANIQELLQKGYSYGDIAILRPEVSGEGVKIAKRLIDFGVPVSSGFQTADPEFSDISVFINLLKVIDGSCDDAELLGVLRYPSFGFTEIEFADIRINANKKNKTLSFEEALKLYDGDNDLGKKVREFLKKIEYYRLLSDSLSLSDFLMQLRHEAGFSEYALTAPSGSDKNNAILSFISSAGAMPSVSAVLEIADRVIKNQSSSTSKSDTDAVFFTTIHKSKGLEFPAVILSGMHKRINQTDASSSVLVGRDLGLALDISNTDTHIKTQTLHKKIVASAMRREKICETVRLLYVGMTRAKQTLIICGVAKKVRDQWTSAAKKNWQLDSGTYLDLIMPALHMVTGNLEESVDFAEYVPAESAKRDKALVLDSFFKRAEQIDTPEVIKAYHPSTKVPSKLSVSTIKKLQQPVQPFTFAPSFLPSEGSISAAERGTLLHKVLQKIGLDEKTPEQVSAFVEELSDKGVIAPELKEHIDAGLISNFLSSTTAKRAQQAETCLFEAPFCLQLAADEAGIADSDEPVIVQGVIDLCFIEDDGWVLVDYKSDKVTEETIEGAANKYKVQLSLYAKALSAITGKSVKQKLLFFLEAGKENELQ